MTRVGIFYHCDPVGHTPSGIDSFIRGILQWAPSDLEYTLFGASTDITARPIGTEAVIRLGGREIRYLPVSRIDQAAAKGVIPFTIQHMWALRQLRRSEVVAGLDVLDFHRIEPSFLFRGDTRPKNLVLHQDMSVIRSKGSDIKWRHLPGVYERIEQGLFGGIDRIFCVRESAVDRYRRLYPHMAAKFSFIPTWVDSGIFGRATAVGGAATDRQKFLQGIGIRNATQVLIFVGRLDRQKNPLLLLNAFRTALSRRDGMHLVLIGDGTLRAEVKAKANSPELRGRVTLMGALEREKIAVALRAADLFVLSSSYEGMPIAVLEALASGLPVVSTDVGELRRVINDGVNGYLSSELSAEALSHSMLLALDNVATMRGTPCEVSVMPYHPEKILNRIYDNHRSQALHRRHGGRSA